MRQLLETELDSDIEITFDPRRPDDVTATEDEGD